MGNVQGLEKRRFQWKGRFRITRRTSCSVLSGRALDAARCVGEVEPDFYAAEVGTFGADGSGDAGAEVAGRADVAGELRVDFAELGDFVHGSRVDFFLGVEACAHGALVEELQERAGFVGAHGFGLGKTR